MLLLQLTINKSSEKTGVWLVLLIHRSPYHYHHLRWGTVVVQPGTNIALTTPPHHTGNSGHYQMLVQCSLSVLETIKSVGIDPCE